MKLLFNLRSRLLSAAIAALFMASGQANAVPVDLNPTPITLGGWSTGGLLTIVFAGETTGGLDDNKLEYPPGFLSPSEVTSFSASFTGSLPPLSSGSWSGLADQLNPFSSGLASLLFDPAAGTPEDGLEELRATQELSPLAPNALELRIGANSVTNSANSAEIVEFLTGNIVAFIPISAGGSVPAPGSLALLGLGLVMLRRHRRR